MSDEIYNFQISSAFLGKIWKFQGGMSTQTLTSDIILNLFSCHILIILHFTDF